MKFYRYDIVNYAAKDINGDFISSNFPDPQVVLTELNLHKETNKGYWIGYGDGTYTSGQEYNLRSQSKWVSKTSKKRYAYPTKVEALDSFIRRTKRRVSILQHQVDNCSAALIKAEDLQKTFV